MDPNNVRRDPVSSPLSELLVLEEFDLLFIANYREVTVSVRCVSKFGLNSLRKRQWRRKIPWGHLLVQPTNFAFVAICVGQCNDNTTCYQDFLRKNGGEWQSQAVTLTVRSEDSAFSLGNLAWSSAFS